MLPTFDIFSGHFGETGVLWIEADAGLEDTYRKMLQIAADKPGAYFVFSSNAGTCVASVDTSHLAIEQKMDCD